jgi:toxin ParE1/3/4
LRIEWTRKAAANLDLIEQYIALDNPTAADKVIVSIGLSVELLSTYPDMGRSGRVEGTRELVIGGLPYIVVYRRKQEKITILRVMHGAMKWPKRF